MIGIAMDNLDMRLDRIDLNLLVTLDVLLAEHHVTRAAERLHLSQPSISIQLAKLRGIFDDPLLLPGPRGMRPTARADALREPLRQALAALRSAVAPAGPFDPAEATQTWRIAASDYSESTILLPLIPRLRRDAPGTRLAIVATPPSAITRQAEQGAIDLAFHTVDGAPTGLHQQKLFGERYVLVGRPGHPGLKRRPTVARFCALDHVIVSPDGGGFRGVTDEALAALGLARRVALSVPHFLFVPAVVAETDLVAMLPERLVRHLGLTVQRPPIDVAGFAMAMLWPERVDRDPAHRWLRETIVAAL